VPGQSAITPDSPRVCCPPERLVTATAQHICCPPGKVRQPSGGLSTRGGLCCTADKVCGNDCCDSLPSFPMNCTKGRCEFDRARIFDKAATATPAGEVAVGTDFRKASSGKMSLVTIPPKGARLVAKSSKPQVLGHARFHAGHKGRRDVKVELSDKGRALLHDKGTLHVNAVIAFSKNGKTVKSYTPLKLKAPQS
jgi:hypothetical protein